MRKHAIAQWFGSVEWFARLLLAIALLVLGWLSAWPLIGPSIVPASMAHSGGNSRLARG